MSNSIYEKRARVQLPALIIQAFLIMAPAHVHRFSRIASVPTIDGALFIALCSFEERAKCNRYNHRQLTRNIPFIYTKFECFSRYATLQAKIKRESLFRVASFVAKCS